MIIIHTKKKQVKSEVDEDAFYLLPTLNDNHPIQRHTMQPFISKESL